jgi:predicted Zn finger-like uncharacterized protein
MLLSIQCDECGARYRVAQGRAGKRVRCKACGQIFRIRSGDDSLPAEPSEYSESGMPIYRHGHRQKAFTPVTGDTESIEAISGHVEAHLGPVAGVFHELVSDLVHIDVHMVGPSDDRPFHTLVTSGMSDLPMTVPEGADEWRYAELLLSLPPSWPLTEEAFRDERNYWPVRLLKVLARLPHEYNTWLGWGHTVPRGDPPQPFAPNTPLCCALLVQPLLVPDEFVQLRMPDGRTVHFYGVVPVYRQEMEFKLKHGTEALLERFAEAEVCELLDARRENLCADEG